MSIIPAIFNEIRGFFTFSFMIARPRSNGYISDSKVSGSLVRGGSFNSMHPIITKHSAILPNCWAFNAGSLISFYPLNYVRHSISSEIIFEQRAAPHSHPQQEIQVSLQGGKI
jgi:hypothetical protein